MIELDLAPLLHKNANRFSLSELAIFYTFALKTGI
jgi:hypothetical protein